MFGVELGRQLAVFRRAATRAAADQVLLRPTLPKTSLRRDMTIDTSFNGPFNWVGGARCNPVDNVGNSGNISPRTGKLLCTIPSSGSQEVERAVAVAREAFPAWAALSGMERGRLLTRAAAIVRENLEDIAKLDVKDNGKPIWEARMDVESVISCLEYYGGVAPSIVGQHVRLPGGSWGVASREPLGVVGGVGAWNYPMQTCTWKVAPALACGNTFVYKPSPLAPLEPVVLAEILAEAGVPDGVYNVVQGEGQTGALLSGHQDLDKLSFTGSVPTGSKIMAAGAVGVKNVTLELGGKSPLIIFDDSDIKNAVKGALMANFLTQGEVCSNGTRVFVQRGIHDRFVEEFVRQAEKMKAGDPLAEDTTIGGTISEEHAKKVLGYVESAVAEGATLACGGKRVVVEGECAGGWYLSPAILTNCRDDMKAVKEEIFGSVASVLVFDSEEEVIKRANDTTFGLAGGVFTKDLTRAHRVVNALEAGTTYINTFNLAPAELPFGGYKMSGIGRENGLAAIEHYTQYKTVIVEMNDVDCGLLWSED